MLFKVYAGSIFCGLLMVRSSGVHEFIGLTGNRIISTGMIEKIAGYKRLRLKRAL